MGFTQVKKKISKPQLKFKFPLSLRKTGTTWPLQKTKQLEIHNTSTNSISVMSDSQRDKFRNRLEKEELNQAEKYLKLQHKRADVSLRETSQSLFASKSSKQNSGSSKGNAGVIYGGQQVRAPDGALAILGQTATYVHVPRFCGRTSTPLFSRFFLFFSNCFTNC